MCSLRAREPLGLGGARHINLEGGLPYDRIGWKREGARGTGSLVLRPGCNHRMDRGVRGGYLSRVREGTGTGGAGGVMLLCLLVASSLLLLLLLLLLSVDILGWSYGAFILK